MCGVGREMSRERVRRRGDEARRELKRWLEGSKNVREENAELRKKLEKAKKESEGFKGEAKRYRKELGEIDKQLLEAAKNEGIDIFGGRGKEN